MVSAPDVRWRQRFQSFRKAFSQLSAGARLANERALSELERMAMIQARNRSSHTYNESTANEIVAAIRTSFVRELELLQTKLAELEASES